MCRLERDRLAKAALASISNNSINTATTVASAVAAKAVYVHHDVYLMVWFSFPTYTLFFI